MSSTYFSEIIRLFRIPQFCSHDLQAKYLIQSCWASQKASAVLHATPFYIFSQFPPSFILKFSVRLAIFST